MPVLRYSWGKDGVQKMRDIMAALRANTPKALGDLPVLAVRDYLAGTRTHEKGVEKLDTPAADVLYFELAGGNWVCVRPSGTEPKIKLYVNTRETSAAAAEKLNDALRQSAERLLK